MPKERRVNSSSFNRARLSPYCRASKIVDDSSKFKSPLPPIADEREWEEARCPICMEHPHNAVLLQCSSREKGCRPYMCDTSCRHSNCFDQFRKSSVGAIPLTPRDGNLPEVVSVPRVTTHRGREEQMTFRANRSLEGKQLELVCPLCRGQITGWVVIEPARRLMNSKQRSCSLETCNFSGNYTELRKHARAEHPYVRPSEADPRRQSDWLRLERQRDLNNAFDIEEPEFDWDAWLNLDDGSENDIWSDGFFGFPGISETEDDWSEVDDWSDFDSMIIDLECTFSFPSEIRVREPIEFFSERSNSSRNSRLRSTSSRSRSSYQRQNAQ